MKKTLAILLAFIMVLGFSSTAMATGATHTTLVLGADEFNGVFSPFFATTGYDMDVKDMTQVSLLRSDRGGAPSSNAAIYVTPEQTKDADGNEITVYTFQLVEGITFSDGNPVTADDIIFSYKVLCDPTYDGSSTIYTTPILGVEAYRYDDPDYTASLDAIKAESENVTDEEIVAHITQSCTNDHKNYGADAINGYTGFANPDKLEGDALLAAEIAAYVEKEIAEYYEDYRPGAVEAKLKVLQNEYIAGNLSSGEIKVPEIEGIKKIDDRTVQVTIMGVDPKAIWNLGGIDISPAHYYGVGFKKGDLSGVRALNSTPMGAGPYTFDKYENNVVYLKANPTYFKGAPQVENIRFQITSGSSKLDGLKNGDFDISDPTASPKMVTDVKAAGLHYELIQNLGYGYIGINAERPVVNDINVRKGLMHMMNRAPAVDAYYGELASVIERPMSKISWAYPTDSTEYYGFDPAKALEYFLAAGYVQTEVNGAKVLAKDGVQLKVEVGIGGDGTMDHPSAPILTQMKASMEEVGALLEINDCDVSILFDRLDNKQWDMWVAAWGATIDPDMYQTYHSEGPSNHYRVMNAELDQLILDARKTLDIEARKAMYFRCLDIIMEEAVEMPVYQRSNLYVFNPEIVDVTTLPKDMTPYYGYFTEVETLKLK